MFQVTKTYGHECGLSACFRQWRATSHCMYLHGYALGFSFVFEAQELDDCNWVIDFGSLDPLKKVLKEIFDHKLIVATDDPEYESIVKLNELGVAAVLSAESVGCEAFAKLAYGYAQQTLKALGLDKRVFVVSCEVREHGANSATYIPERRRYYVKTGFYNAERPMDER